jgi:hypothetical protein
MNILKDQTVELLPFHAINEFMRNDFRLGVVRSALSALPGLPGNYRASLDRLTKKYVKVPGFRNSDKAPAVVKAVPIAESFEKSPELVGAVLAAWAESHTDLRQKVYDFMTGLGWEVLPIEADRVKLGGFFVTWPKEDAFDTLNPAFKEKYPDAAYTQDEVLLMVVWITMHLPYQMVDKAGFQCIPKLGTEEKPAD